MRALVTFSPAYRNSIKLAIAQQFLAVLSTAFLLDGGGMLRLALFAVAAHWALIITVMLRRRSAPTAFDLGLIGVGFVPVGIASVVIAGLLGRAVL
jgi:hypothetical protein